MATQKNPDIDIYALLAQIVTTREAIGLTASPARIDGNLSPAKAVSARFCVGPGFTGAPYTLVEIGGDEKFSPGVRASSH